MARNKKITFSHFEKVNNPTFKIKTIRIYCGDFGMGTEHFEDVEIDMTIKDGIVELKVLDSNINEFFTKKDAKKVQRELENIDWQNGYEFFEFHDNITKHKYNLIGNENSKVFDLMNS